MTRQTVQITKSVFINIQILADISTNIYTHSQIFLSLPKPLTDQLSNCFLSSPLQPLQFLCNISLHVPVWFARCQIGDILQQKHSHWGMSNWSGPKLWIIITVQIKNEYTFHCVHVGSGPTQFLTNEFHHKDDNDGRKAPTSFQWKGCDCVILHIVPLILQLKH